MHETQAINNIIIQPTNVQLPKGKHTGVYPSELPKDAHWGGMPVPSALPKEV